MIINSDCLEAMDTLISKGVVVDAIITDLPFGTTSCKWDVVIPFDEMWERLNKLIKPDGAIVLFGIEPFSSTLRMSNIANFKYDWIWQKPNGTNPFLAKSQPMRKHELISIFNSNIYNPQMEEGKPYKWNSKRTKGEAANIEQNKETPINNTGTRYPSSIQPFNQDRGLHPTQKPVDLLKYLINTYTVEGDTVLDFTMGSGSTIVACVETNRHGIGIERELEYYDIAKVRIKQAEKDNSELPELYFEFTHAIKEYNHD